jgi:outer membrane receptor protein involved in Fe transport
MSKPKTHAMKTIACLVAGILSVPALSRAENKAEVLETGTIEVVGTTPLPGIGVSIDQVPANVQVVKGEALQEQQSLGIADYMSQNLLGVSVNETQNNPYQPDVNYHGFTASPLLGTPQGLSVYQDGVRINEPFGDSVNWDLIPSAAISGITLMPGSNPLFGLNTLGGALSIQTKRGDLNPGGAIQAYAGSWNRRAVEAEYGGKVDNGANYYFSGNVFSEDGWRDYSNSNVRQYFGKLGWTGEKTDFNVSLTGANNTLKGNGYTPASFLKDNYDSVYTQPDITSPELVFLNTQFNHWISDNLSVNGLVYYRHNRIKTYNADGNDDYDDTDPGFGVDPAVTDQGVVNRTKSTERGYGLAGQLNWTTDANLLIVGAGYDRSKVDFSQTSQLFSQFNSARGVGGVLEDDVEDEVDLIGRTYTGSLFATDTYNLTSKLALTGSARYNYTRVKNHDQLIPLAGTGSLTGEQAFHRINPALGLTFSPSASLNFFGGYNEGSRAPSSIEIACSDPASPCLLPNSMAGDPPTLRQVVAKTWEGGARGRLGNGLKWSASAYRTNSFDDIQFIASNTTGAGYFDNVGKTRRTGLDMGLGGDIGNFRWNVGYSYVKATYESQFTMLAEGNVQAGTDCQGNAVDGAICVNKGDQLAGIPEHQFKLRGEYSVFPDWVVGGNLVAFSDQYARGNENNADPDGKVAGYGVLNLDTRYNFGTSGWQLFAKVNNVFDREYYTGGILGENAFTGTGNTFASNSSDWATEKFLAPGAPRAGWVGLRYEFGGAKSGSKVDLD